jgi:hypothetical protein
VRRLLSSTAIALGCTASCTAGPKEYDSQVLLVRVEPIRRDEHGAVLTLDVEMSFEDCPGEQRKTVRGPRAFAECMLKHKPGDRVPVHLRHLRNADGAWDFSVVDVGGCKRSRDPNDEASFAVVQVCSDLVVHGTKVGFRCDRRPSAELVAKCPWFRVH